MAVAPLGADPEPAFARLAALADALRADHPEATWVSAGMSGDPRQRCATARHTCVSGRQSSEIVRHTGNFGDTDEATGTTKDLRT